MEYNKNEYIYQSGDKYVIIKSIHGKSKYYGTFTTLDEARRYRDFLVDHNWNVCCKKKRNSSHIFKNRNKYMIMKRVNGKNEYFGIFDTLEEAKIYRDFLEEHDWDFKYKKSVKPSNIHCDKRYNTYIISKMINHKKIYFGRFDTLEKAKIYRDFLEEHDWDVKYKKSVKFSNIYYNKNQNIYVVRKTVNHEKVHFGTYHTLEEAVHERDFWESIDWNLELLDLY